MDRQAGAKAPQPGSSLANWMIVVCLMATMIFSLVDRFAISLLVEPIKSDLALSDRDFGLLSGIAFGLFYAFMGLPMGLLADRWSRKGTILLGVGVWSVSTAACGFASNFWQLLGARIGVGAGEAGLAPASYSIIADLFPRNLLSRALSVFQLGATVGSGLALWIVGLVYSQLTIGGWAPLTKELGLAAWQSTFILVALPGIFFLILISILRLPTGQRKTITPQISLKSALRKQPALYSQLYLAMSGILMVNYALLSWVPAIMQREFQSTPADVGSTYGLIVLLAGPVAMLSGGWIADLLYRRGSSAAHAKVVLCSAALLIPGAVILYLANSLTSTYVAIAFIQFAVTLPVGVAPALIQLRTMAEVRSQVSALYVLVVNLAGLGFGPVLIGAISDELAGHPNSLRYSVALVSLIVSSIATVAAYLLVAKGNEENLSGEVFA